jgi:hypothetical protein
MTKITEIPTMSIDDDGGHVWRLQDGTKHRVDGPAQVNSSGSVFWYYNGKLHRTDGGPAASWIDGANIWMVHGVRHRVDAPAVIGFPQIYGDLNDPEGADSWYYHGEKYKICNLNLWPMELYLGYIKWRKLNE